jgi:hypothetical protein
MNLTLLAYCPELDPQTREACGYEIRTGVGGQVNRVPLEARFPYFAEGFVSADLPRSSAFSDDIVRATTAWGLADEQGNVLGKFASAKEADGARRGAKLTLQVEVPAVEAAPEPVEAK